MIKKIRQWLEPPIFEGDEEKTIQARTANTLFIYLFAALSIAIVILIPLFAVQKIGSWILTGVIFCVLLAGHSLIKKGKWQFGIRLVFLIIYLCILVLMILSGGSSSTAMFFFAIVVLVAGFFLEADLVNWFTVPTFLLAMGISLLQDQGLIAIPRVFQFNSLFSWFATGLGLMFMIKARNLFVQNLKDALTAARVQNALFQSTEISLDESESRYKSLFENNHAVMLIIDPENAVIMDANPAACAFYGWDREALLKMKIDEINMLTSEEVRAELQLAGSEKRNHFLFKHRLADNSIRDVEVYSGPLMQNGKILIYSIIHDITERKHVEDALQKSELHYRLLFDAIPESVLLIGKDRCVVSANLASARLYGYELPQQLEGLDTRFLIAEKDRDRATRIQVDVLQGKETPERRYIEVRRDGSEFVAEVMSTTLYGPQQEVLGYIGITRDITAFVEAEKALRESENRFRAFVEQSPVSIGVFNLEGNGLYANRKFMEVLGLQSDQEVVGRPAYEFFAPEFREQSKERTKRRLQGLPVPAEYESICVRSDGTEFPVHMAVAPIQLPGGPASIAFLTDISESKQAEERILQSEKKYRELFQVNKDGIAIFLLNQYGPPTTFVEVNDAAPRMLGYTREEMLQLTPMMLEPYISQEQLRSRQSEMKLKGILDFETILLHKDGRPIFTEFTAQVIQYEGKPAVMNIVRDVTDRKRAEETLIASEARFREVLDNSLDASYKRNLKTNTYDYFSPVFSRIFGYSQDEFTNLPLETVLEFIHPDDRATGDRVISESLTGAHGTSYSWEYRIKHKDGQYRWLHDQFIIMRDTQGQPDAWIGSVSDITERKERENELQVIANLGAALRSAPTRAEMLPVILEQLVIFLNCETISIEIIDPLTGNAITEAAHGMWKALIGKHQKNGTGINAIISKTRKPYLTNNLKNDPNLAYPEWTHNDISGGVGLPLIAQNQLIGFLWMGRNKDIAESEVRLLASVADMAANAIHRATLHELTQKDAADLKEAYESTLEGWVKALELRDQETEGHARNVVELTVELARAIGISEDEMDHVRRGALLHDIGKMGVPDSVLLKPGTLNDREWEIMRRHPEYAYNLLEPIEYLRPVLDIPYCHHEKWDGSGYPRGLKGEEIPLMARVFAIVDVWDALMSDRPYRKAWGYEQAINHIQGQAAKHFDPKVVAAFLAMVDGQLQPKTPSP